LVEQAVHEVQARLAKWRGRKGAVAISKECRAHAIGFAKLKKNRAVQHQGPLLETVKSRHGGGQF
jgi:hypothetical protein